MLNVLEIEKIYLLKITGELYDKIAATKFYEQDTIASLVSSSQMEFEPNERVRNVYVLDFDTDDDDNEYIIVEVQTYFILS